MKHDAPARPRRRPRRLGALVVAGLLCGCTSPDSSERELEASVAAVLEEGGADAGPGERERRFAAAMLGVAEDKLRSGDAAGALPLVEEALLRDPASGRAHLLWARAGESLGVDPEEVGSRYARAVELLPEDPEAHRLAAAFAEGRGDKAAARRGYERAVLLRKDDVEALIRLASLELDDGEAALAARHFAAAAALDQSSVPARFGLAEAAERMGDLLTAEAALEELVRMHPEVALYRSRLVAFYRRVGREDAARAAEKALEKRDPKDERKLRTLKPSKDQRKARKRR